MSNFPQQKNQKFSTAYLTTMLPARVMSILTARPDGPNGFIVALHGNDYLGEFRITREQAEKIIG